MKLPTTCAVCGGGQKWSESRTTTGFWSCWYRGMPRCISISCARGKLPNVPKDCPRRRRKPGA